MGVATTQFGAGQTINPGGNRPWPTALEQSPLKIYRCPSDSGPPLNPQKIVGPTQQADTMRNYALSNYRAVMGTYPNYVPVGSTNVNPYYGYYYGDDLSTAVPAGYGYGGVMFHNSRVRITHVTDGTSNTVAIGECRFDWDVATSTGHKAAIWAGMTGVESGSIYISDVTWWIDETSGVINGSAPQAFSSQHRGGAFFGFCDGSVRFFQEGGDVRVLMYAGGRNDGKVIQWP
jgi:hypothetical protein